MQQQWKDAYPGFFGKLITTVMLAVGRDVEQGSYSALSVPSHYAAPWRRVRMHA
jgi:hypothetical protein